MVLLRCSLSTIFCGVCGDLCVPYVVGRFKIRLFLLVVIPVFVYWVKKVSCLLNNVIRIKNMF